MILADPDYVQEDSDPEDVLPLARLVKPKLKRKKTAELKDWKENKNRKLRMKGK